MIRLIIYLLITILILVIIVIKVQCYFKTVEEFNMYGYTCNRCGTCAEGVGRVNCGGTSSGNCVACTGQTYKSDSSNGECITVPANSKPTTNKQDFTCDPGYYKSGNSCSTCGSCSAGKERLGCDGNSPGECELCPSNSYKPEAGTGGCTILRWGKKPTPDRRDWMCENGYFYNGPNWCSPCTAIPCDAGQERVGCGVSPSWHMGECRECRSGTYKSVSSGEACTPVPDNSTPTWNKRGWDCNAGYFKSGNSCSECGSCPAGEGRVNCGGTSEGECSLCTGNKYKPDSGNGGCINAPPNSEPTSNRTDFTCDAGYIKSGNSCSACGTCPEGVGRVNCSETSTGSCSPCTGQTYKSDAGHGECIDVPDNATTSNNIEWSCDTGYYKSGNSCIECGGCPLNEYRSGCTPTSAGSCNTCPYGKYKNDTTNGGISSCIPCGMGRIAKNSHGNHPWIYCVCPDGYAFSNRPGWGEWCKKRWAGGPGPEWAPGPSD